MEKKLIYVVHDHRLKAVDRITLLKPYRAMKQYQMMYTKFGFATERLSPDEIVAEMIKKIQDRKLHLLVIHAHGSPGVIALGNDFIPGSYDAFTALRPYFDRQSAGIELHSCNFASWRLRLTDDRPDIREEVAEYLFRIYANAALSAMGSPRAKEFELTPEEKKYAAQLARDYNYGRRALLEVAEAAQTTAKAAVFS
ncbi:MAG: hypothetical protein AAFN94_03590, partial [Pseudomonadota bacterium]